MPKEQGHKWFAVFWDWAVKSENAALRRGRQETVGGAGGRDDAGAVQPSLGRPDRAGEVAHHSVQGIEFCLQRLDVVVAVPGESSITSRTLPRSASGPSTRSGTHAFCICGKPYPSGMTPTTVVGVPPSWTVRPIGSGSPPRSLCHAS